MDAVKEYGGFPLKVRTDCGTENGLVAEAQCYSTGNDLAYLWNLTSYPTNRRVVVVPKTAHNYLVDQLFSRTYWNNTSSLLVMNYRWSACGSVFPD